MDQPSVLSESQRASTMDVNVSLQGSQVRMSATVDVTGHAVAELSRLARHRMSQSVSTLQLVDRLKGDSLVRPLITDEVSTHLQTMERLYLKRLEVMERNASQRLITLADWTPPGIGLLRSLLRVLGVSLVPRKDSLQLELADDVEEAMPGEGPAEESDDDTTHADAQPDDVSDQHRHIYDTGFQSYPTGHPNGSSGDIEGDGWRIINR